MEHMNPLADNEILHSIVARLYVDRRVKEFISKLQPAELQADLLQHCICEVYRIAEKYPGKIEALDECNQLWPWFVGLVRQQMLSNKSTFYSRYRRQYEPEEYIPATVSEWPDMDLEPAKVIDEKLLDYAYTIFESKPKVLKFEAPKQGDLFNLE